MASVPVNQLPGGKAVVNPGFGFGRINQYSPDVLLVVQGELARTIQQLRDLEAHRFLLETRYKNLEVRFTQLEEFVDRGPWSFLFHKVVSDELAETRQTL